MKSLYFINSDVNTNINNIEFASYELEDFQIQKISKVLDMHKNNIMEIAIQPFGSKNSDCYTIIISYKNKEDKYNQYIISCLKALKDKELKPQYDNDLNEYTPIKIHEDDILIYRDENIHKGMVEKEVYLSSLIKKFNSFIEFEDKEEDLEDEVMKKLWLSLTNEERLYIFVNLNRNNLERYYRYKDYYNDFIHFDYPTYINNKWYGYYFSITYGLHNKYSSHYLNIIPTCINSVCDYFENDDMTEWRTPILPYLSRLRNIEELSLVGMQTDIILPFSTNKTKVKCIVCSIDMDKSNIQNNFIVYNKMQGILKDIMVI